MDIRVATSDDIPGIVAVLRQSLGESKLPKSQKIWRYKHIENPFGSSLVLLAILDGKIVGVRAFMRWSWQCGKDLFSTLRAVDTATLPDYQGKGIFRQLTMKAIEIATENGDHFIFNTPNSQSMPGYLKMGWRKINKISIQLFAVNPIYWKPSYTVEIDSSVQLSPFELENLVEQFNKEQQDKEKIFTPKSFEYLAWRYFKNPLQDYIVKADKDFFVAGYIKSHKYVRELRITDAIFVDGVSQKKIKKILINWARKSGVQFISISNSDLKINMVSLRGNYGPVLTFRSLNLEQEVQNRFVNIESWNYSLGDLELF